MVTAITGTAGCFYVFADYDLTKDCLVYNYFGFIIVFELAEIESKTKGLLFRKWLSNAVDSSARLLTYAVLMSKQLVASLLGEVAFV